MDRLTKPKYRYPLRYLNVFCICLCALFCPISQAKLTQIEDIFTPVSFSHQSKLVLNGYGHGDKYSTDQFIGGLYLAAPISKEHDIFNAKTPKQMVFHFVSEPNSDAFIDKLLGLIRINNTPDVCQLFWQEIDALENLFHVASLRRGEKVIIDYHPKQAVTISVANRWSTRVSNSDFFNVMLKTWLGENPYSHSFKQSILGLNNSN